MARDIRFCGLQKQYFFVGRVLITLFPLWIAIIFLLLWIHNKSKIKKYLYIYFKKIWNSGQMFCSALGPGGLLGFESVLNVGDHRTPSAARSRMCSRRQKMAFFPTFFFSPCFYTSLRLFSTIKVWYNLLNSLNIINFFVTFLKDR